MLQNTKLEAASEVGEMMGSMEGEGWFTAAAGVRQEFTRNQISLCPQLTEHMVIVLDIVHG